MKRQRSLSSANSLVLFSVLPDLARKFYDDWKAKADLTPHLVESLMSKPDGRALQKAKEAMDEIEVVS